MPVLRNMLPPTVDCPHCGANMSLDDQERVVKKFNCPGCGEAIDLTGQGSTLGQESPPPGNKDNAYSTVGDPEIDAKDFFKAIPAILKPEGTPKDLYESGMDVIISSSVLFSTPFVLAGTHVTNQLSTLFSKQRSNVRKTDFVQFPIEKFLSDFFIYSNAFVDAIAIHFADLIRRETIRADIRAQTTESLGEAIRKESFRKLDEILDTYSSTMRELGIQLESTSAIRSAVQGSFIGGGLQLMASRGGSSQGGMITGAVIGAAMAEAKKKQLRDQLLQTAISGVRAIVSEVQNCNRRLMDQYCAYMWGERVDFSKRDGEIDRGQPIIARISQSCLAVLDKVLSSKSAYALAEKKMQSAKGCFAYFVWLCVVSGILAGGLSSGMSPALFFLLLLLLLAIVPAIWHTKNSKRLASVKAKRNTTILEELESSIGMQGEMDRLNQIRAQFTSVPE